jgi:hypothetical protein
MSECILDLDLVFMLSLSLSLSLLRARSFLMPLFFADCWDWVDLALADEIDGSPICWDIG